MASRSPAELADCIEQGVAEHPTWTQTRGWFWRDAENSLMTTMGADTTQACAFGFALADGWGDDDLVAESAPCPACPNSVLGVALVVTHLNDSHSWPIPQIVAWLRSL